MIVQLGSTRYQVKRVKDVLKSVKRHNPNERFPLEGFNCPETKTIWVQKSEDPMREAEVLLHEALHHIFTSSPKEEAIVERICDVIFPTLWKQGWRPFGWEE